MKTDVDKNRCFRNLLYRVPFGKLGLLLAFLIVASHLWGQGITVKGRVTDTDDAPVIGASVLVEGTESGMITDLDGNYVINNVPSDAVLVFSYVGMVTQKVAVSGRHVVNVNLYKEYTSLKSRELEELPRFVVMIWQPFMLLRSASLCLFRITLCMQRYDFVSYKTKVS